METSDILPAESIPPVVNHDISADCLRVIALLLVISYHVYALTNTVLFNNPWIDGLIMYGGEIGVNLFFFLSGFGIWYSLRKSVGDRLTLKGYKQFIEKRIIRIVPNYYFHLFVILVITDAAIYISIENWKAIITHLLFIHNFFIMHHGAINGTLWTMAVIFQFYLIAPLLFLALEKKPILFAVIGFVSFIWPVIISGTMIQNMFYGSQITDRVHIFMMGMVVAKLVKKHRLQEPKWILLIVTIIGMLTFFYGIVIKMSSLHELMPTFGCVFYGAIIYFMSGVRPKKGIITNIIAFWSKYEYGIYLWHFPVIATLLTKAPLFIPLIRRGPLLALIVLVTICAILGSFVQQMVDTFVEVKTTNRKESVN